MRFPVVPRFDGRVAETGLLRFSREGQIDIEIPVVPVSAPLFSAGGPLFSLADIEFYAPSPWWQSTTDSIEYFDHQGGIAIPWVYVPLVYVPIFGPSILTLIDIFGGESAATSIRNSTGTFNAFDATSGTLLKTAEIDEHRVTGAREVRNYLLNSGTPATQNITLATGTFTCWLDGVGGDSITTAAGTAVGTGFGAATPGTPNVMTITTGGSVSFTVAGAPTRAQVETGSSASEYVPTTTASAHKFFDLSLPHNQGRDTLVNTYGWVITDGGAA